MFSRCLAVKRETHWVDGKNSVSPMFISLKVGATRFFLLEHLLVFLVVFVFIRFDN